MLFDKLFDIGPINLDLSEEEISLSLYHRDSRYSDMTQEERDRLFDYWAMDEFKQAYYGSNRAKRSVDDDITEIAAEVRATKCEVIPFPPRIEIRELAGLREAA